MSKKLILIKRFITFPFLSMFLCWLKYKALVSPKAEIEITNNLSIGSGTKISSFTKIKSSDGIISIGKNVSIATGCFIGAGSGGCKIGDWTLIGPNSAILSNSYQYDRTDIPIAQQGWNSKGTVIGNNVFIGAGVVITDGSVVGDGVMIAPNSVVYGEIPSNMIVQGNPAKTVFQRR